MAQTFKVFLQQYVEKTAVVEIEADDAEAARALALDWKVTMAADWHDGDDAYDVDVYMVKDLAGNEVWER